MAKKSLIQKAIDGVDHMIHPDHSKDSEELDLQNEEKYAEAYSTSENNSVQNLRKFDKFKTTGVKQNDE